MRFLIQNLIIFTFKLKYRVVVDDTLQPWAESSIVSLRRNRACAVLGFCYALGYNSPFVMTLLQSQLEPWLHIHMLVRMGFPRLSIWSSSYKPIVPWVAHQSIFPSGLQVSPLDCAWLSCLLPQPTHWFEVVRPRWTSSSWSVGHRKTLWTPSSQIQCRCLKLWCGESRIDRWYSYKWTPWFCGAWWMLWLLLRPIWWSNQ